MVRIRGGGEGEGEDREREERARWMERVCVSECEKERELGRGELGGIETR